MERGRKTYHTRTLNKVGLPEFTDILAIKSYHSCKRQDITSSLHPGGTQNRGSSLERQLPIDRTNEPSR